ncbi:hypothetical protein [Chryseobacterium sp. 2R14A]|uniref:hypothetical protein n=1 Tax=Chryseobacterium sp. 2R14A TaxID=3380353 RepID=UPI003CE9865D
MSLDTAKQEAISKFIALMDDMFTREQDSRQEYAERFFTILIELIKKAEIKYTNGLNAGSNPVTGTFNGELK